MRIFLFYCYFWIADAAVWRGPLATPVIKYTPDSLAPIRPTSTPAGFHGLLKRVDTAWASNLCGWANGDYNSKFTCRGISTTCLWNSHLKVVGCGNSALQPYVTACVDENSSCDAACSANPAIWKCTSGVSRYCYTAQFPNSYSLPTCGSATNISLSMALTYGGVPTPIYLPRFLGVDGTLTVETQYPDGYTAKPTSSSGSDTSPSSTSQPSNKKINIGPIVGGVIGGIALLVAVGIGMFIFMRRGKRIVVVRQLQPVEKMELPPGGRNELDGRSKPAYEIGVGTGKPLNSYELG